MMKKLFWLFFLLSLTAQAQLPTGVGWHGLGDRTNPEKRALWPYYATHTYPIGDVDCVYSEAPQAGHPGNPVAGILTSPCAAPGTTPHTGAGPMAP